MGGHPTVEARMKYEVHFTEVGTGVKVPGFGPVSFGHLLHVDADSHPEAIEKATAKFRAENPNTKVRFTECRRVRQFEVTFRYRKDKRKRETFIVEGTSERMARNNGRYIAHQSKPGLEYDAIKIAEKS